MWDFYKLLCRAEGQFLLQKTFTLPIDMMDTSCTAGLCPETCQSIITTINLQTIILSYHNSCDKISLSKYNHQTFVYELLNFPLHDFVLVIIFRRHWIYVLKRRPSWGGLNIFQKMDNDWYLNLIFVFKWDFQNVPIFFSCKPL